MHLDTLHTGHLRHPVSSPLLWRYYTSWVSSKIHSQGLRTGHWMTCHPLWLPLPSHPSSTYFSWLGPVGHTLFTLGSLGCWFEREITGTSSSQSLGPINPNPFHSIPRLGIIQLQTYPKGLHKNSPYIDPNPTTKGPDMYMPFLPTNSTEQNLSKFSHPHSLSKEDQQMMIQAKAHTRRHLQAL